MEIVLLEADYAAAAVKRPASVPRTTGPVLAEDHHPRP
jgi:hypothetical protein